MLPKDFYKLTLSEAILLTSGYYLRLKDMGKLLYGDETSGSSSEGTTNLPPNAFLQAFAAMNSGDVIVRENGQS